MNGSRSLLAAVLFSVLAVQGTSAQISQQKAERLMRESGMWMQLDSAGAQVVKSMDLFLPGKDEKTANIRQTLAAAMGPAFSSPRLHAFALLELSEKIDPAQMSALEAWFSQPAAKRATRCEVEASKSTVSVETRLKRGTEMLRTLPAERVALLKRFVEAAHLREYQQELLAASGSAMVDAMRVADPLLAERAEAAGLKAELRKQVDMTSGSLEALLLASAADMYASLSDADLRAYVEFLDSSAGRHLSAVSFAALKRGLVNGADEMGRSIAAAAARSQR